MRNGHRVICEVSWNGGRCELHVRATTARVPSELYRFADRASAILHHDDLEAAWIENGWRLETFETSGTPDVYDDYRDIVQRQLAAGGLHST